MDLGTLQRFVTLAITERDLILIALRNDCANGKLQAELAEWKQGRSESGWLPTGETSAVLSQLRPRYEESEFEKCYRLLRVATQAPHLLQDIDAAYEAHREFVAEALQAYELSQTQPRAWEWHCRAFAPLATTCNALIDAKEAGAQPQERPGGEAKRTKARRPGRPKNRLTARRADFAKRHINEGYSWPEVFEQYRDAHPEDREATARNLRYAYERLRKQ